MSSKAILPKSMVDIHKTNLAEESIDLFSKIAGMSAVAPQAVQQGFFRLCRLPACPSPCDCDATQRQTVVVGPWAVPLRDVPRHPCPLQ